VIADSDDPAIAWGKAATDLVSLRPKGLGAAIDVWMRRWCEQNPTKKVFEAAAAIVLEQGK
jgi:hypothetical protein